MQNEELIALAEKVEAMDVGSNEMDVIIECAFNDCRPNAAGTKVIYINKGREEVYWARDWTIDQAARDRTAKALRTQGDRHE